ncbi:hypothetical protein CGZ98_06140 [Enemella evansiae]|uniref:antitoxin VbhA family protein n=1 Tax=Enemella evansiae TaxID=2016499 RepID=UPI000B979247|nr:antitoxin VbhA family protein [Enemella evansiae]OYO13122.1 hypothetical protein CGZ98_06140 [Enemella evansiae]
MTDSPITYSLRELADELTVQPYAIAAVLKLSYWTEHDRVDPARADEARQLIHEAYPHHFAGRRRPIDPTPLQVGDTTDYSALAEQVGGVVVSFSNPASNRLEPLMPITPDNPDQRKAALEAARANSALAGASTEEDEATRADQEAWAAGEITHDELMERIAARISSWPQG